MPSTQRSVLATAVTLALGLSSLPASASPILEEIVVTATKRPVGLQDVPLSVAVMQGQAIAEKGLTGLEDLSIYMPNVTITEGAANTNIFIRGVGSGSNFGFEQSVGTFVDGVYFGRGRSARNRFLDIERVEVLKGPQSTLFGKNTVAGALNITTSAPSSEFESFLEASYRSELEGTKITGMISGALTETLSGRLVMQKYDDGGYVKNNAIGGNDGPQQDSSGIRAKLSWAATENLKIDLKIESSKFDVEGRMTTISEANPFATSLYQAYGDPGFEAGFDYNQWDLSFDDEGIWDDTESNIYQLTAEYTFGESTLRSITAFTDYKFSNELDADLSPLKFISRGRHEQHEQFSQEFLWSSSIGDNISYLAGAYYQTEELQNQRHTRVAFSAIPPIEQGILDSLVILGLSSLPSTSVDADIPSQFQQDADTWSVFTDVTISMTDQLHLTAGIRYSEDHKDVEKRGGLDNLSGVLPDSIFELLYGPAVLNFATVHNYQLERDEEHTTGRVVLQWDANADTMFYLSWSNGYKSGGFDEDNALGNLDFAEFEDESVVSLEIGSKLTLLGGRGRLNMAYFQGEYKDVQVSAFDGTSAYVVGNAAETEVRGFEADIEFAVSDKLSINSSAAWLDATYKSFSDAVCNEDQALEFELQNGTRAGCTQDLSGQALQYAPEYSFNFGARYNTTITSDLNLGLSLDYLWTDDVETANNLDEHLRQKSHSKINARIGLSDNDENWSLALIARNLTDEKTFASGGEVPLASSGFSKTYFRHIDPPRSLEISLRYNFQ